MNLLVLEGGADLLMRIRSCVAGLDVNLYASSDEWGNVRFAGDEVLHAAVIGTGFLEDQQFRQNDWSLAQGLPVLWIGANQPSGIWLRGKAPLVLHQDFTCSQLKTRLQQLGVDTATTDWGAFNRREGIQGTHEAAQRILFHTPLMQALIDDCKAYSAIDSNVLLIGETGTGKELFARMTAQGNPDYGRGPFITVNCGAIPEHLFESLFFGHAKGSFTGAWRAHKGYMSQAHGGTLYLDEIGDLPLLQQVKLLRALEDGIILPVGSSEPVRVDFRLIAATNLDLHRLMKHGHFRADLYYRIAVVELEIPSLEARGPADKSLLFTHAFQQALDRLKGPGSINIPSWLEVLVQDRCYSGNVREVTNLATRVAVSYMRYGYFDKPGCMAILAPARRDVSHAYAAARGAGAERSRADVASERDRIIAALNSHSWRRREAAEDLGISRKTLWEKMRKYDLSPTTISADCEASPSEQNLGETL
jgi:DNA-binding NtrC family response regulator